MRERQNSIGWLLGSKKVFHGALDSNTHQASCIGFSPFSLHDSYTTTSVDLRFRLLCHALIVPPSSFWHGPFFRQLQRSHHKHFNRILSHFQGPTKLWMLFSLFLTCYKAEFCQGSGHILILYCGCVSSLCVHIMNMGNWDPPGDVEARETID